MRAYHRPRRRTSLAGAYTPPIPLGPGPSAAPGSPAPASSPAPAIAWACRILGELTALDYRDGAGDSGVGADVVGFVVASDPAQPRLVTTRRFYDEQPTGMEVVGDALVVAGGRGVCMYNVKVPAVTG